ncbi:hypothetical protein WHR41_03378 [Cladosporium halotolerans]|uniref:DUF1753-domain-containing protein n=1 Tax=Cladosporium halotolerans TaxID=1052096 RepID=A0AB34KW42_9PEZI
MALPSLFRVPKPKSVLGFITLRSATELIFLTLLFNKVTGLYGILAIFTGYELNALQLSHYVYSLIVLGLISWLFAAIRQPEQPLKVVGLAFLLILDSLINAIYTSFFGASWFIVLAQHLNEGKVDDNVPGAGTIEDTAGFTSPEHNVSKVEVIATPAEGAMPGQVATAYPTEGGVTLTSAVFESGSMASLTVIGSLWILRIYFCLVVLSYARGVVRSYVLTTSTGYTHSDDPTMAENPFREGREEGEGWKGKLGRAMMKFPSKGYWLGREENEGENDWVRSTSGRFNGRKDLRIKVPEPGVGERERRARSGTGPPPPPSAKNNKVPE